MLICKNFHTHVWLLFYLKNLSFWSYELSQKLDGSCFSVKWFLLWHMWTGGSCTPMRSVNWGLCTPTCTVQTGGACSSWLTLVSFILCISHISDAAAPVLCMSKPKKWRLCREEASSSLPPAQSMATLMILFYGFSLSHPKRLFTKFYVFV